MGEAKSSSHGKGHPLLESHVYVGTWAPCSRADSPRSLWPWAIIRARAEQLITQLLGQLPFFKGLSILGWLPLPHSMDAVVEQQSRCHIARCEPLLFSIQHLCKEESHLLHASPLHTLQVPQVQQQQVVASVKSFNRAAAAPSAPECGSTGPQRTSASLVVALLGKPGPWALAGQAHLYCRGLRRRGCSQPPALTTSASAAILASECRFWAAGLLGRRRST